MIKQQTSGQRRLRLLPAHAENGAPGPVRVVVDPADFILLPRIEPHRSADKAAFRHEDHLMNKLDDVRAGDAVTRAPLRHEYPTVVAVVAHRQPAVPPRVKRPASAA